MPGPFGPRRASRAREKHPGNRDNVHCGPKRVPAGTGHTRPPGPGLEERAADTLSRFFAQSGHAGPGCPFAGPGCPLASS